MNEAQANKIIELLESLNEKLDSVIRGDCTLDVTVKDVQTTVEVCGSVTAYEPR